MHTISIHALREEGDSKDTFGMTIIGEFLSTPSARRATERLVWMAHFQLISIHALREEGDQAASDVVKASHGISIHALREEGDVSVLRSKSG